MFLVAAEIDDLLSAAHQQDFVRTPYSWRDNDGFESGHPRTALSRERNRVVTTEQLPEQALLRRLYQWDPLTEFIGKTLGLAALYRSEDPNLSISYNVLDEGDEVAWHFDSNQFIVTIMLQAADAGGEFECAPYVRSEEDDNYDILNHNLSQTTPPLVQIAGNYGETPLLREAATVVLVTMRIPNDGLEREPTSRLEPPNESGIKSVTSICRMM